MPSHRWHLLKAFKATLREEDHLREALESQAAFAGLRKATTKLKSRLRQ